MRDSLREQIARIVWESHYAARDTEDGPGLRWARVATEAPCPAVEADVFACRHAADRILALPAAPRGRCCPECGEDWGDHRCPVARTDGAS